MFRTKFVGDDERLYARAAGRNARRNEGGHYWTEADAIKNPHPVDAPHDQHREWQIGYDTALTPFWSRMLGHALCFFGFHDKYEYGACYRGSGDRCTRCEYQRYESTSS